ncbi:MAG: hypothetical protein KME03_16845 [Aphanocapsa lilacina HA4352-LM1]|jgi:hypothetical protein|nr:hypothetical protein [Aphanocapsa lilacina HA4352-LM1]
MTTQRFPAQSAQPAAQDNGQPQRAALPTMFDLPSELPGESGLPDDCHRLQAELLSGTFVPPGYSQDSFHPRLKTGVAACPVVVLCAVC